MMYRRVGGADAWFTDRNGGRSVGAYATLNLADHVSDDPEVVAENRRIVAATVGQPGARWVQPRHVHGTAVLIAQAGDGLDLDRARSLDHDDGDGNDDGDGVASRLADQLLVAVGADCAPIAIANDSACAAVHAGWRGASDGVIAAGVDAVRSLGEGPVRAVVGPCVCANHYEFGAQLLAGLAARLGPQVATTTTSGLPAFDLRAAIGIAFARAEVDDVEILDVCTFESLDHYSHRRDGITGRHAVVVSQR